MISREEIKEGQYIFILMAIYIISFLKSGILKGMGIMLPILPDQFETNTYTIGIVVSFFNLSGSIMGILVQPLTKKIKVRYIIIVCGILATSGLIISFAASNIPTFFAGMFLLGFTSVGDMLAMADISSYFTKHYKAALNFVTTSLPVATMTFAPLTKVLIDNYGWRGALLILAGISFHCVAAAVSLRPPKKQQTTHIEKEAKYPADYSDETRSKSGMKESGNKTGLLALFDASLFCNTSFLIILFIRFLSGYINNGWIVYLYSIATNKGLNSHQAVLAPFFCGIGILFIRTTLSFLPHILSTRQLLYLGSVLDAVAFLGIYFASTFWAISVSSIVLGLGDGILGSQMFIAANNIFGKSKMVGAMAYLQLVHGCGFIVGGYMTGWLYELVGDFHLALIVLCVVSTVSFLTLGAEDTWRTLKHSSEDIIDRPVPL